MKSRFPLVRCFASVAHAQVTKAFLAIIFIAVFLVTFLALLGMAITGPEYWVSTAYLRVPGTNSLALEAQRLRSPAILAGAVDNLDLTHDWGFRYSGNSLRTSSFTNGFIAISYRGEDPRQAAQIANAIASVYCKSHPGEIATAATPASKPFYPNLPHETFTAIWKSLCVGLVALTLAALLVRR